MADEMDIIEQVRSAAPVAFEIDGHAFSIRQMTPAERDRLFYVETRTRDKVLADYRADGLNEQPISDDMQAVIDLYMASLEQAYQTAIAVGDDEAAIQAARDLEDAPARWPQNLAQERANEITRRAAGRWAVDNLLNGDRAEFTRLTAPDPLKHDAVNEALQRWQRLAAFDPNSAGRSQS